MQMFSWLTEAIEHLIHNAYILIKSAFTAWFITFVKTRSASLLASYIAVLIDI